MLGLNRYFVEVEDPNPDWAREYARIASQIRGATGALSLEVEHIGSTSIPFLEAKPIIDVGLLLEDEDQFDALITALATIDLTYRGNKGAVGGRLFIRESAPEVRTHHVHAYFKGAPEWDRYLLFRERLRASAALRAEYGALKRRLAARFRQDRFAYTDAKSEFIQRVLTQAP